MSKGQGFIHDVNKCLACRSCVLACQSLRFAGRQRSMRQVQSWQTGVYPQPQLYHLSLSCRHCRQAPCLAVCPAQALWQAADGSVRLDAEKCLGCGLCAQACPYQEIWVEEGKAVKCDSCYQLRQAGQQPACVAACPMRCLSWGDLQAAWEAEPELCAALPAAPDRGGEPATLFKPKPGVWSEEKRQVRY